MQARFPKTFVWRGPCGLPRQCQKVSPQHRRPAECLRLCVEPAKFRMAVRHDARLCNHVFRKQPHRGQLPGAAFGRNAWPNLQPQLFGTWYTLGRLQRLMQVAARKATKYFTGYLQKPQPLGKNELQQAAKHLSFLDVDPSQTSKAKQYRKVLQRLCGDLEFRCSVRPLTEETMLAGFWDGNEVSSAECIRSFPVVPFLGHEWLHQLDRTTNSQVQVKPCRRRQIAMTSPEVYGWRGTDPRVYYLSLGIHVAVGSSSTATSAGCSRRLKRLAARNCDGTWTGDRLEIWWRLWLEATLAGHGTRSLAAEGGRINSLAGIN